MSEALPDQALGSIWLKMQIEKLHANPHGGPAGRYWVAYLATDIPLATAVLLDKIMIGSIALSVCEESPEIKERFKKLMEEAALLSIEKCGVFGDDVIAQAREKLK